jgi:hypothetical protein
MTANDSQPPGRIPAPATRPRSGADVGSALEYRLHLPARGPGRQLRVGPPAAVADPARVDVSAVGSRTRRCGGASRSPGGPAESPVHRSPVAALGAPAASRFAPPPGRIPRRPGISPRTVRPAGRDPPASGSGAGFNVLPASPLLRAGRPHHPQAGPAALPHAARRSRRRCPPCVGSSRCWLRKWWRRCPLAGREYLGRSAWARSGAGDQRAIRPHVCACTMSLTRPERREIGTGTRCRVVPGSAK